MKLLPTKSGLKIPDHSPNVSSEWGGSDLARWGVVLDDRYKYMYRCLHCGQTWGLSIPSGGKRPRGWWICPEGCNRPMR